jgi:hypothetical protein
VSRTKQPTPSEAGRTAVSCEAPNAIKKIIADLVLLHEKLSPVTGMAAVEEFTPKRMREHLRELTAIVGDMAMDVKELKDAGR